MTDYYMGCDVLGAMTDDDPFYIGFAQGVVDWDGSKGYGEGAVVRYWGGYFRAARDIAPPFIPWLQSGEEPTKSSAWTELSASQAVQLMGDVGTGAALSVDLSPEGPGGAGGLFTDHNTILAAQKALKVRGIDPGPLDGVFGTKTEAALFQFSGEHGPPSAATLA